MEGDRLEFDYNPLKDITTGELPMLTSVERPEVSISNKMLGFVNKDIKNKAKANLQNTKLFNDYIFDKTTYNPLNDFTNNKTKLTEYNISATDAYTTLNSGDLQALYKDFIPNTDNEDRLARQQTTGEKWLNGLAKFGTGTLNTVVGATIGSVYGIGSWISEGNFQAVYDNDFTKYLDDLNTKMRYELPNYYTEQERNTSFDVTSTNFWADKVLGAAAFTVGAIVSEGIWVAATGGASLTTATARWAGRLGKAGKWSKAVLGEKAVKVASSSYKSWLKKPLFNVYKKSGLINKDAAILASKTAEGLNTARFMLTSSGYEAGVEALHYKKEAEENFYRNFYELNGRQPNGQEISDFTENLENSSNAVFGGNMALLSVSNAVMFGSLFNIKNPFRQTTKGINRRLFGIGVEETAEKGVFKAIKPTKNQKLFSGVYSIAKPLATEGLFEEGGQGSLSKAAGFWTESGYDPKYNGNTIGIMEALSEGMAETYGTKEGWEEIGIGFIIGGGASMIQGKGKPLDLKQIQEARKNQETIVEKMNTFSQDVMVKRMIMNNKIQGAVEKELKSNNEGNSVEAELANQDKFMAELEFRHSIGEDISELAQTYRIALQNMTEEQFKEAGIENAEEYINTVVDAYSSLAESYKKNIRYAEAVYGVDVQNDNYDNAIQAQALAYAITTGETSSKLMEDALSEIGSEIGSENQRALTLESELQRLTKNQRSTLSRNVKKLKAQKEKQDKLVKQIQKVQNAPKETEGDRQSGVELATLNNALLETQQEISVLESEINLFKDELAQERTRRRGLEETGDLTLPELNIISLEDLLNLDEKLENINNLINSYEGQNPQLYRKLVALVDYYNSAKKNFVKYNEIGVALTSGKVKIRPKKVGGLIGKLFDKKKYTQDEFTQAFLSDTLAWYVNNRAEDANKDVEETTSIDELFIPISQQRVDLISEKLRSNQPFSKREQRLYETNKETIDNRVVELNKEKGDNPLQTTNKGRKDTIIIKSRPKSEEESPQVLSGVKAIVAEKTIENIVNDGISKGQSFEEIRDRVYDKYTFSQFSEDVVAFINGKMNGSIKEDFATYRKPTQKPNQTSNQSEVDQLKQRLEDALEKDYYPLQYVGEDYNELVKNKPSENDIERFRQLVDKDRTAEEEFEYEDLYQKLSNWRVLDSAMSGSQSLAEIINLIQQLETQVEQDETVTEVTEEFDTQIIDDNIGSGTMVVYELTQNTTGNATAKLLKNGRLKLSHIKIDTILERLGGTFTKTNKKRGNVYITTSETSEEGSEVQPTGATDVEKGDIVYLVTPEGSEGSIEIILKPTGAIEINYGDFINLQQSLNLYIVDSGQTNWTYKDVYEVVGDEFIEKESDFVDDDISGNIYELQREDEVEFYYDSEDSYNQKLFKDYKKGKISKEELRNQVKIYIRKGGKNYGTLKSLRDNAVDENMTLLRDRAVSAVENEQSTTIGNTTVSQIMLGSPKFVINENNKPSELPITDRAIEEVVTTGYVLDNEFTLSNKTLEEKIDQSFVGKISKNQEGKKIPVVVVKKGNHFIAYPITVTKKDNSQATRFEAIMNNEFSNEAQKVSEINDLLISLGIAPSTYNLIDLNEQDKLEKIQEDLRNHKVFTTAQDFADSYDKKLLRYDATIKIDLEDLNRSISSPKVRIDLDNITVYETSEFKYESMSELEDTLSDLSLEINSIINKDYIDSKGDAIENKFTDVYAEDSVIKNPENQLEKMHNVRMLREAFPLMPHKFKNLLGQEKVKTVEKAFKKIEFLQKQIDTKANKEVQNKKNELKC